MKSSFLLALFALLPVGFVRAADPATDTIIECAGVSEMVSTDTETTATFRDKVVVTGTNLKLTCDFLTVIAIRKTDLTAAFGKADYFKSLVATGHVRIVQGDREATCGRAEIFPGADKIVLSEETPTVRSTDDQYVVTGPVIELYRGQRKAVIPAATDNGPGTRITLPALKDLGYDKEKPLPPAETAPKTEPVK